MHKHLVAAAAVVIAAVAVSGVMAIQREVDKTRESIKEQAGEKIGDGIRQGITDGVERTIDKAAEVPGKVLRDVKDAAQLDPAELLRDAIKAGQGLTRTIDDAVQEAPRPVTRRGESSRQRGTGSQPAAQSRQVTRRGDASSPCHSRRNRKAPAVASSSDGTSPPGRRDLVKIWMLGGSSE